MDKKIPKADYSEIAKYYDKFRISDVSFWASKIIEYGRVDAGSLVLDVGCGTGRFPLSILTIKDCVICALDLSIDMLRQAVAKDRVKRILWVQGDGQHLPFQKDSFDCVYMTLVIHHIEDKELALREMHRVLKKEGNFVIITNSHSKIKRHILRHFPGVAPIDLKRFPTIPRLKKLLEKVGFRNVQYHALRYDSGYLSTEEYLEKVRNKYISTLALMSEDRFQKSLKIFEKRIKGKYGDKIKQIDEFVSLTGKK